MNNSAYIEIEALTDGVPDIDRFQDEYKSNDFESIWEWPDESGYGRMNHAKIKDGLICCAGDLRFPGKTKVNFSDWLLPMSLTYGITGRQDFNIDRMDGGSERYCAQPAQCIIANLPKLSGDVHFPKKESVRWFTIYIDPVLLSSFIDVRKVRYPTPICALAEGNPEIEYLQRFHTSSIIELTVQQILDCPYAGKLKRLYLEGKILELLAHSFSRLARKDQFKSKNISLRPQEVERIEYARTLMRKSLQNPPKLLDLARRVGLHHTKLNAGFRELHGTTIFGYLRQIRISYAKALLDEGRMNVTEVAFEAGYASPSHFTNVFKDSHGVTPKSYLQTRPSKW